MQNPMKKPVRRDTTLSSGRDMLSRLLLMLQIAALIGGILLLLYGGTRGIRSYVIGGIILLVSVVVLIPVRRRWFSTDKRSAPPMAEEAKPQSTSAVPITAKPRIEGRRPRILLLNAALGGSEGNTAAALEHLVKHLSPHADIARITLAAKPTPDKMLPLLEASDAFVIATGTHWDSWSSHLQAFLEIATPFEGTPLLLGKPVACVITEHSAGGKAVLSRLQGVLVTLGCAIPPMSGLVLSRASLVAAEERPEVAQDFWCVKDLATVAANLLAATQCPGNYQAWDVDREHLNDRWLD